MITSFCKYCNKEVKTVQYADKYYPPNYEECSVCAKYVDTHRITLTLNSNDLMWLRSRKS